MKPRPALIRRPPCLGLLALVATACASLPPKQQVSDIGSLAGRWEGQVSNGQSLAWEVARDGSVSWRAPSGTGTGKLSLRDGRLFYESSTGRSAFFDYHEGDGKRILKTPDVELRAQ
jgi:hypothetical protein